MRVLEKTIDIQATPDEVWEVLTDFAEYDEWNPFITSIAGAAEPGARLAVALTPPGGRTIVMKPTVRAADRSRRFAWLGRLGVPWVFDGAHEFLMEPGADGTHGVHPTRDVPRCTRAVRRRSAPQDRGRLRGDERGAQAARGGWRGDPITGRSTASRDTRLAAVSLRIMGR